MKAEEYLISKIDSRQKDRLDFPNGYHASEIVQLMEEYASIKLSEYKTQMREEIVKELEDSVEKATITGEQEIMTATRFSSLGMAQGYKNSISIVKEVMK
jgi:hypothetical protein